MDVRKQTGTVDDQPQTQHRQHNGVRQQLGIGIDQAQRNQGPGQQQHGASFPAEVELPGHHTAQNRSQQFNQRITDADPLPAVAAAAAQQGITDQRQILPGLDLGIAVGAMGVGQNEVIGGLIRSHCIGMQYFLSLPLPVPLHHERQAVDDYVKKAADDQAQQRSNQNKGQHMAGHIFNEIHGSDDGAQLENWQVHGNDQTADKDTQNRHDHRLQQGSQVVHLVIYLSFVVIRDLFQHAIQVTGLLTNPGHLYSQSGEYIGGTHGKVELGAGGHVTLDIVDRVVEHDVTCSSGYGIQSLHQGNTGGKGG